MRIVAVLVCFCVSVLWLCCFFVVGVFLSFYAVVLLCWRVDVLACCCVGVLLCWRADVLAC